MMTCVVFFCKGVFCEAPIEPNLSPIVDKIDAPVEAKPSLPVDEGELSTSRCYMTSKPGRDCKIGDYMANGAVCTFSKRCGIDCKGQIGCKLECRCLAV